MTAKNKPSSLSIFSAIIFIVLLIGLGIYSSRSQKKSEQKNTTQTSYQLNLAESLSTGPKDAKVTFTEYFDFECPACQMLASEVMPTLEREYAGRVNFVFKQFPLPQHDQAKPSAAASICAADQGKFNEYRDLIIENYESWTKNPAEYEKYAKNLNLDLVKFNECRQSKQVADFIDRDFQEGVDKGIQATPTVFINGEKIEGVQPISFYRDKIDTLLNK